MKVGDLEIEVVRNPDGPKLRVQGRPYGVETAASGDELRALAGYLATEANNLAQGD